VKEEGDNRTSGTSNQGICGNETLQVRIIFSNKGSSGVKEEPAGI
jgi:hypothetical protein